MKYRGQVAFLENLHHPRINLGIKKDLSLSPELFGHELQIKGLYIWGHAFSEDSKMLANMVCDVILFNETNPEVIQLSKGYLLFRIYDLQEFPYLGAVKVHKE